MLFKTLAPAVRAAPLIIRVSTEGEGLRVMIHQQADELDKGLVPLQLSVAAGAEALDAELPEAIAAAFNALDKPTTLREQVEQQARIAASNTDTAKATPKKAAATKSRAAEKKAPAPKKAPAKKKIAPAPRTTGIRPPAAASTKAKPVKHIASKPTAEQCITAFYAYLASHPGEPIKREAFIKSNPTGRRFERLFGNWEKFLAAASKHGTLNPPGDTKTKPLALPMPGAKEPAAPAPVGAGETAELSTSASPAAADQTGKGAVTGIGYVIYHATTGELIGGIVRPPEVSIYLGEVVTLHDRSEWKVASVIGNQIKARPWTPVGNKLPGLPDSWPFPTPASRIGRSVVTAVGDRVIATGVQLTVETGQTFTLPDNTTPFRVLDFDDNTVWVESAEAQSTEGASA